MACVVAMSYTLHVLLVRFIYHYKDVVSLHVEIQFFSILRPTKVWEFPEGLWQPHIAVSVNMNLLKYRRNKY